jgi:hypothetical protein
LPEKPVADPSRELPSLSGGERLCNAFELYRQPQITLDQLVLLVSALARRDEVALVHCNSCDGAMLMTLLRKPNRLCPHCAQRAQNLRKDQGSTGRKPVESDAGEEGGADPLEGFQRPLFFAA